MPQWKHTIRVGDLHAAFRGGKITISKVARLLAERLSRYPDAADIVDIIGDLENVKTTPEYDRALADLYDYGDIDHRLWIDPSKPTEPAPSPARPMTRDDALEEKGDFMRDEGITPPWRYKT